MTVDEYIAKTAVPVQEMLQAARQLILDTVPEVEEIMKYGAPTYVLPDGVIAYYLYGGKEHVNLGFLFGAELDDREGLLIGKGSKDSRHVHLDSPTDLDNPVILSFLRDTVELAAQT